mmetsp:Transcript_56947/g.144466  ORF Transcript_56947/g.144466 Transcript_56947/m.144466 type:complete len:206 (+) Transcript_56947:197-814(+)
MDSPSFASGALRRDRDADGRHTREACARAAKIHLGLVELLAGIQERQLVAHDWWHLGDLRDLQGLRTFRRRHVDGAVGSDRSFVRRVGRADHQLLAARALARRERRGLRRRRRLDHVLLHRPRNPAAFCSREDGEVERGDGQVQGFSLQVYALPPDLTALPELVRELQHGSDWHAVLVLPRGVDAGDTAGGVHVDRDGRHAPGRR